MNILAQVIGYIGLSLGVLSFQQNSQKRIVFFQILASSVFLTHFTLLGAYTGAALNGIGVIRAAVFYNRGKKWADSKVWVGVFSAACLAVSIITWDSFLSLLPAVAMIFTTLSFYVKNPKIVRRLALPSSPLWMTYNFFNGSYPGILTEAFLMTSIIVGMVRFDRKRAVAEVAVKL